MANLPESSVFDDVYQLEITDRVIGGSGGKSNQQAQQLVNRTKWLKDAIAAIEGGGGPFDLDASGGTLPAAGSGPGGAVKRKDQYRVTVAGTISGVALQIGDELIARIDAAAVIGDYIILQGNIDLATATILGLVKLAQDISGGSAADRTLSIAGLISIFAQLNSPAFTGNPTVPNQTALNTSTRAANTKYVDDAVAVEAGARATAVSTEASTRGSADTTLQTNINNEATARGSADTTLQNNINAEASTRGAADTALQNNKADKAQGAWTDITFFAVSFSNVGAPYNIMGYLVDNFGKVSLKGYMNCTVTAGGPVGFLSVNSYPCRNARKQVPIIEIFGGVYSNKILEIRPDGTSNIVGGVNNGASYIFDGASYWPDTV